MLNMTNAVEDTRDKEKETRDKKDTRDKNSCISNNYNESNNKYLKSYEPKEESNHTL